MNRSPLPVLIRVIRHEYGGVASFELESSDHSPLPSYAPGAHLDVQLPSGVIRSHSLLDPASESGAYRVAVKREPEAAAARSGCTKPRTRNRS